MLLEAPNLYRLSLELRPPTASPAGWLVAAIGATYPGVTVIHVTAYYGPFADVDVRWKGMPRDVSVGDVLAGPSQLQQLGVDSPTAVVTDVHELSDAGNLEWDSKDVARVAGAAVILGAAWWLAKRNARRAGRVAA